MAFVNQTDEDKDNAQGMNGTDTSQFQAPQPTPSSSQSSTITPTGTASQAASAPKSTAVKSNTSGSAPGFQNYAKANQGKAQDSLNSAIAKNVANSGQAANSAINQATTQFGNQVDAGSLANRENAVNDVTNTVASARALAAGNNVDQANQDRFKDVINAQYAGPESLRQSGLYNQASGKVTDAQNKINNTGTANGREELLKDMYQKRGDYTAGLNKLDSALLNSSQQGVQNLQNTAAAQGNVAQNLDKAQVNSATASQNRTNEIQGIQDQARNVFSTGKTAEEQATEDRLSGVVKNWDQLPDYFKNIIKAGGGGANLNSLESQILGVGSGEGLYNLGTNAIKTGVADKSALISKDEQARQAALASLAGLDNSKLLNTNLNYTDANKAGTQSALDALDLAGTRKGLNAAEQNFQKYATGTKLYGTGSKKNKTNGKTYYNEQNAHLNNVLQNAGYNFGTPAAANNIGNEDLLKAIVNARQGTQTNPDQNGLGGAAEAMNTGLDAGGSTPARDLVDMYGSLTGINALTGAMGLGTAADTLNTANKQLSNTVAGQILTAPTLGVANTVGNALGIGNAGKVVNSVLGGGANTSGSKAVAEAAAKKDLNNKIQSALNSQGFSKRVNVVDNAGTTSRLSALQSLLSNIDKTNTKA